MTVNIKLFCLHSVCNNMVCYAWLTENR